MIELEIPQIAPIEDLARAPKNMRRVIAGRLRRALANACARPAVVRWRARPLTAIQIRDVYPNSTSIPGVKEDVTQIVLKRQEAPPQSFATHPIQLKRSRPAQAP